MTEIFCICIFEDCLYTCRRGPVEGVSFDRPPPIWAIFKYTNTNYFKHVKSKNMSRTRVREIKYIRIDRCLTLEPHPGLWKWVKTPNMDGSKQLIPYDEGSRRKVSDAAWGIFFKRQKTKQRIESSSKSNGESQPIKHSHWGRASTHTQIDKELRQSIHSQVVGTQVTRGCSSR